MLVDFKVTNFRSFKTEQEFSMETGEYLRKYPENTLRENNKRLLKSAMIFGANANGKTNLIKSLQMLKYLVTMPTNDIEDKLASDTFGNNEENTKFEITFISNKEEYYYLLEYNKEEVVTECLKKNNKTIFNRSEQSFEVPKQIRNLKENVRKNQLLLYFAQKNNERVSIEAYHWFAQDLIIINFNRNIIPIKNIKKLKNKDFKDRVLNLLKAADFDITDIEVQEAVDDVPMEILKILLHPDDEEKNNFGKNVKRKTYKVYTTHRCDNGYFTIDFSQESTGTQAFLCFAFYLLEGNNKVLLADEFDCSYHTELAQALLKIINSQNQQNQFILTTHNPDLLDCKLRQDQIWFVDKNAFNKKTKSHYGESELFSLFEFDDAKLTRHDVSYKKRYLQGLYGGTQIVNQSLLEAGIEDEQKKEQE